jgi:hypothetical protein
LSANAAADRDRIEGGLKRVQARLVHLQKQGQQEPQASPHYSRLLLLQARLPRASRLSSSLLAAAHR